MTEIITAVLSIMISLLVILITAMVMNPLVVVLTIVMIWVAFLRISSTTSRFQNSSTTFPVSTVSDASIASSPSQTSSSSVTTSSSRSWKYDVFLSFRGEDTRKTFANHLHTTLEELVACTYKDDAPDTRGKTIGPLLLNAIKESQIAIIVFSENYADSSWCLNELGYIMKCNKEEGQIVLPIFYHVNPSDIRNKEGKWALAKHKEKYNDSKIESWEKALFATANMGGWEISHNTNGYEAKCIKDIVDAVLDILLYSNSEIDKNLVGMGTRCQDLKSKLQIGSDDVRMIGIWGIGGGGKTTLASSLYTDIYSKFDMCCFLGNIKGESSKSNGLKTLQENFLSTVLKKEVKIDDVYEGKLKIKSMLRKKNVLLVLDNIDNHDQLEALAESHDWFGKGSRIIITTRNKQLLRADKVEVIEVSLLSNEQAIRLLYRYAYNANKPIDDYKTLSQRVVSYCAGLPLAVKVVGSFLYDKNKEEWISTLDRLKDIPEMKIVETLKISYDGLTSLEKEIFLDIACFWRGMKKDVAMEILDARGFHPCSNVTPMIQKGLITIDSYGKFEMHDLVQEMGHCIVRGEYPNNPEKHNRLWRDEDINDMCYGNTTMENSITEAIVCYNRPPSFGRLVSNAKKLRLIYSCIEDKMDYEDKTDYEMPESLSNELRYMYWKNYPTRPFPKSFQPRKLVVLRLKDTLQEELWKGNKDLPCLKMLEITNAKHLVQTPVFGELPCLEKFVLRGCRRLKKIEGNFHASKHLKRCEIICDDFCDTLQLPEDLFDENIHLEDLHLKCTRQPSNFYLPLFIRRLTLSRCGMRDGEIPFRIGNLSGLQELDLSKNDFSIINFSLLRLTRLKLLNLSRCKRLLELPKLPSSIAILKANGCESLEVDGDIINSNCRWLCQVLVCRSKCRGEGWQNNSVSGGERWLEVMLQGNAIENSCKMLLLDGLDIPKGFRPRLLKGKTYRLKLPENWLDHFCGFVLCAVVNRRLEKFQNLGIIMKHVKGGQQEDVYWEESTGRVTMVGYISFGSLKQTSWFDPTSTAIEFSFDQSTYIGIVRSQGIGVRLVSKTISQLQTTSSSDNDYKCNFLINQDLRSVLRFEIC